jgi:tRNA(Ile)-lysidine synthase
MSLLQRFKEYIADENLFQPKDKLLLAVSGGVDSIVLCELCKQASFDFVIAHCNFQLRGAESDSDEAFVGSLGVKYGVEVLVKKFDTSTYIATSKKGIQEAARDLRYEWFNELLGQLLTVNRQLFLVTAHHANDNIETILMNFFKGTGINGLHGILPKQGKIIRPLLFAKKEELKAFAEANKLQFVEDASNATDKYTRNYFRNQLIPDLQKVFPAVEDNLMGNIQRFREMQVLYNQSVDFHKSKLLEQKGAEIHIPVLKLLKVEPLSTIVYEIIKDFGFTANQTPEVIALLQSESGRYVQSPTHKAIKNRKWLIIAPNQTTEAQNILIEKEDKEIAFVKGKLHLKSCSTVNCQLSTVNSIVQLDADEIVYPLLLRPYKQGDYFYPLGMDKKKKLSKFFIDQKLSLSDKENTWVIEMNKKIIWVVGLRIDNRFKILPSTKNILQLSLTVTK